MELKNSGSDKDYHAYLHTSTHEINPPVTRVSLAKLVVALAGCSRWEADPMERDEDHLNIPKYNNILQEVVLGLPMHRPWLSASEGQVDIENGRHRLYVLLDHGYTHAEVVCDSEHLSVIEVLK